MRLIMHALRRQLSSVLAGVVVCCVAAAEGKTGRVWKTIESAAPPGSGHRAGAIFSADQRQLHEILRGAGDRGTLAVAVTEMELPTPDGRTMRFAITETTVMAPELARKFPEIRSFRGKGLDDPLATAAIDWNPSGVTAQIVSAAGIACIEPCDSTGSIYSCYSKADAGGPQLFQCLTASEEAPAETYPLAGLGLPRGGRELRTYRLAVAAQGEFTQANGGTVSSGLAAVVATINRVNQMYEPELGIRFQLVANNDRLIFTDPQKDPYSQNVASAVTLTENQQTIDRIIGSANYDIGHVFNTGQYGVANIGVVCVDGWKARGCIGTATPGGEQFWVDYVAHEMGHQFGANHTFNSVNGLCNGNRSANNAYEPGSGSTIMSYAGFCGGDDLQGHAGIYFHSRSYDEIMNFVLNGAAANCAIITPTGNTPPNVEAGPNYAIPRGTPFKLTASGNDPDGDAITFCWEQRDLGPAQSVYDSDNGSSPLFRSMFATGNPSRNFPRLTDLLNNTRIRGEQVPTLPRTMKFRVTARDGRGGIATSDMQLNVTSSGPFAVASHNDNSSYSGIQDVRWNVAGTGASPINVSRVNILLSTNNGASFDIMLASGTPNDGLQKLRFPNINTSLARIKIEAVGNIFFDVNDSPFSIHPSSGIKPDLNSDGNPDLVWQHINGSMAVWYMRGTDVISVGMITGKKLPAGWRLAGFNDFNLDGYSDFLFQHENGQLMAWFMEDSNYLGEVVLRNGISVGPGWRVAGMADFNENGQTDILLQNDDGRLAVWFLQGVGFQGSTLLRNGQAASVGWRVAGVNDFDGDGKTDILWQHKAGALACWYMNGSTFLRSQLVRNGQSTGVGWRLAALNDLNGDSRVDFVLQNHNGRVAGWFMDGINFQGAILLRNGQPAGRGWTLMGPK